MLLVELAAHPCRLDMDRRHSAGRSLGRALSCVERRARGHPDRGVHRARPHRHPRYPVVVVEDSSFREDTRRDRRRARRGALPHRSPRRRPRSSHRAGLRGRAPARRQRARPALRRRRPRTDAARVPAPPPPAPLQSAERPSTSCEAPGSLPFRSPSSRDLPFQPSGGLQITSTISVAIGSAVCGAVLRATRPASDGAYSMTSRRWRAGRDPPSVGRHAAIAGRFGGGNGPRSTSVFSVTLATLPAGEDHRTIPQHHASCAYATW